MANPTANNRLFVQYGCGLCAPTDWINFDASPSLWLQRLPIVGPFIVRRRVIFPNNVRYGDVARGLPLAANACDGVYASHVLEHLSLDDFRAALVETRRILKVGGRFRLVVPDLEALAAKYLDAVKRGIPNASYTFLNESYLGVMKNPRSIKEKLTSSLGNSAHLWMWDRLSMKVALNEAGFRSAREAKFGDSEEGAFSSVEDEGRFHEAVAFEAIK